MPVNSGKVLQIPMDQSIRTDHYVTSGDLLHEFPARQPLETVMHHNVERRSEPLDLTLLMDAARGICATAGILPRTIFHLPYGDVTETLENKQVVFFTGPVVSPGSDTEIQMPQPSDIYGQWSWTHHPDVKVTDFILWD